MPGFWIFDRLRTAHQWQEAFDELSSGPDLAKRFIVTNWRMDHRVSEDREGGDLATPAFAVATTIGGTSWWKARDRYFREEICSSNPMPSAYLRSTNRANLAARLPTFDRLVHVGSLNRSLSRALRGSRAADVEIALASLLGRGPSSRPVRSSGIGWPGAQVRRLAEDLQSLGEGAIRQVAGLLSDALGDSQPPWWACFSEEIQALLDADDVASIRAALGLGHMDAGEWLLVWQYFVGDVEPVYQPTVVEANDSPYHFPSPPGYGVGITMPLDPVMPACREVIHRPLRGTTAVERSTGKLLRIVGPIPGAAPAELSVLRAAHRKRLVEDVATSAAWLERHPEVS